MGERSHHASVDPLPCIPATITAGDSLALRLSLSVYPATAGWALTWHRNGPEAGTVAFARDGDAHVATLTGADTRTWAPGHYRWLLRAELASVTITVQSGSLDVQPDLARAMPGAGATWEERTLAIVEAALAGTLEGGMKLYMIAGRQVQTFGVDELLKLRNKLRATVDLQRSGSFGTPVRFDVVGMR